MAWWGTADLPHARNPHERRAPRGARGACGLDASRSQATHRVVPPPFPARDPRPRHSSERRDLRNRGWGNDRGPIHQKKARGGREKAVQGLRKTDGDLTVFVSSRARPAPSTSWLVPAPPAAIALKRVVARLIAQSSDASICDRARHCPVSRLPNASRDQSTPLSSPTVWASAGIPTPM